MFPGYGLSGSGCLEGKSMGCDHPAQSGSRKKTQTGFLQKLKLSNQKKDKKPDMVVLIIHLYFFAQAMLVNEGLAERPVTKEPAVHAAKTEAEILYSQLEGCLEKEAFTAAWQGMLRYNPEARMLAIADLSQASDKQRFYIINLEKKEVNLQTWVAHGKNSGDQYAL
ncbi:MAG: murein L,D-transpeptidase catalytic domain family protein, partial [Chitinophagaceae bacterium]|nr:murein L,D-transpeptidase catalytic domain family protein [Chitinophagaceae bacterium]